MSIVVTSNELPESIRGVVEKSLVAALEDSDGNWTISITSDLRNHAWDVEVRGPGKVHWERRFSGDDRDATVIAEAIRSGVGTPPKATGRNRERELSEALSALAIQGIAFTSDTNQSGETEYIVDRVQLKESEILYLYRQRALTAVGIRSYLLNRKVA